MRDRIIFAIPCRFTVIHRNIPNMLGQLTTAIARVGLNIENLVNRSRNDFAYTIVDVSGLTTEQADQVIQKLTAVPAVGRVRLITKG